MCFSSYYQVRTWPVFTEIIYTIVCINTYSFAVDALLNQSMYNLNAYLNILHLFNNNPAYCITINVSVNAKCKIFSNTKNMSCSCRSTVTMHIEILMNHSYMHGTKLSSGIKFSERFNSFCVF